LNCKINLNNYIWRKIMCNYSIKFESQYKKEHDLVNIRKKLLETLKKPQ
jgi:uncharacterized protein YaaW (UPF0174 family)